MAPEVVTLGEAMVVVRPTDGTPVVSASRFVLGAVGAESNVATALSRLGHRVAFVGRVGEDAAGSRVRRSLRAEGIDVSGLMTDRSAATGLLVRDLGGHHGISVDYHRTESAGSRLHPDDLDPTVIADARFLHLTGLTCGLSSSAAAAVERAASIASDAGTKVSLDPNLRFRIHPPDTWRCLVAPLLPHTQLVIGSPDELRIVTGASDTPDAIDRLRSQGVQTIVLRGGTSPTRFLSSDDELQVAVESVDPVDPVGAGDAFAGGLLSGILDDLRPREAVERAHAVARRCVQVAGDTEGLPTRSELDRSDTEVVR